MGSMTLLEMQTDLQSSTGRTLTATDMNRWVNHSLRKVAYAFQFKSMQASANIASVAGTATYAVAADFRALADTGMRISVPAASIGRLLPESRERYQRNIGDLTATGLRGVPAFYHKYGALIYLRPIPDAVYTIPYDYWKKITAMAANGDVTPLTDEWDEIVFLGALYRAFRGYNEHDRMVNTYNDYLGMIRSTAMEEDLEEFPVGGLNIISDESSIASG